MLHTLRLIAATLPTLPFSCCSPSRVRKLLVRLRTTFGICVLLWAILFASMPEEAGSDRERCRSSSRIARRRSASRRIPAFARRNCCRSGTWIRRR